MRTYTSTIQGIEAFPVTVEIFPDKHDGTLCIEGLPPVAKKDMSARVRAALFSVQGFPDGPPVARVELSSPVPIRGPQTTDFAVAVAVLLAEAYGACKPDRLASTLFLAELGISGELRPARGVVPALLAAKAQGLTLAIVADASASEAVLVPGIEVRVAQNLAQVIDFLAGREGLPHASVRGGAPTPPAVPDLVDVRGQAVGRRVLEIAAAGHHNVLFVGPPGAGKTMLARRLPGILPPPELGDLTVASIQSAAGLRASGGRPFRAPHHTASDAAIVGGGDPIRPGEVTLAHGGVLLLDELPEFRRSSLDTLGRALDEGIAVVCRGAVRAAMPARPLVVAAMNPCPCGGSSRTKACTCPPHRVEAYQARIRGPLLSHFEARIRGPFLSHFDLIVRLPPVTAADVQDSPPGESSATVQARVIAARERLAADPTSGLGVALGVMRGVSDDALRLITQASDRRGLSAREVATTIRVARTIAHLDASDGVQPPHVAEALSLRRGLASCGGVS